MYREASPVRARWKYFMFFLPVFFLVVPFSSGAQTQTKVTVYGIKGMSGVALLRLFESVPRVPGYSITVQTLPQADSMAALFISGEAKIGFLPPNMAAKIAASGRKIQIAAVTGTGMVTLLSGDPSVRRIEDLKGKTVEVAGHGATPDLVFRKIVQSKGLVVGKDIDFGYALAYPEMALALAAGRIQYSLLPEPFATMAVNANSKLAAVGDIQKEWMQLTAAQGTAVSPTSDNFPMTVLVVNSDFAAAHSNLVSVLLQEIKESIEWVTAHPREAGALAEKHGLGLSAQVVEKAIPRSNYVFIPLPAARAGLEKLFSVFLEFAPASIGNALPPDGFYYISP